MPITPDSTSSLYLCTVELDPDYNYTVDFDSVLEQQQFFKDRVVDIFNNNDEPNHTYSYIKASDTINVEANIDDLLNVNYLYYYNTDKIYYAFITSKDYVNDNTTKLHFDIDVLQTFRDDYEIKESFVEREHQDRIDKLNKILLYNIKKEDIELGEKSKCINREKLNYVFDESGQYPDLTFAYIFAKSNITKDPISNLSNDDGIPTGYFVYVISNYNMQFQDNTYSAPREIASIEEIITDEFLKKAEITQVVYSKIPPFKMKIDSNGVVRAIGTDTTACVLDNQKCLINIYNRKRNGSIVELKYLNIDKVNSLPDHTQKKDIKFESKLRTYPFAYQTIQYGTKSLDIRNEYKPTRIKGIQSISNEATSVISEINKLNEITSAYDSDPNNTIALEIPNYVTLRTSEWEKYLTENRASRISGYVTQGINAVAAGSGAVASALKQDSMGAVYGGLSLVNSTMGIINTMTKEIDLQNKPIEPKVFSGDLSINKIMTDLSPLISTYEIQDEYKKQVYDYFYHYGYTCKEFKIPNIKSRYYFNYIKTLSINIKSTIDKNYLDKIKSIYNNGITFWHYRNGDWKEVNNYEYENAETFN